MEFFLWLCVSSILSVVSSPCHVCVNWGNAERKQNTRQGVCKEGGAQLCCVKNRETEKPERNCNFIKEPLKVSSDS